MNDAPSPSPLIELIECAQAADAERNPASLHTLAVCASTHGVDGLAVRTFLLARQRGWRAPLSEGEIALLLRYEMLTPLVDRAIEFRLPEVLRRVAVGFSGHPDLHPHGRAAVDALIAMGETPPALPARRQAPEHDELWNDMLAGDDSLLGWAIRHHGALFGDRLARLAKRNVPGLSRAAGRLGPFVELVAGKAAAIPYYRLRRENPEARLSLAFAASLLDREIAVECCADDQERTALGLWVLGRPRDAVIDPGWLRCLDAQTLTRFAEQEGQRWLNGEPERFRRDGVLLDATLAEAFQPWFLAVGDFDAVLGCLEVRAASADREQRTTLDLGAARILASLGRREEAAKRASNALLLAPADIELQSFLFELAIEDEGLAERAALSLEAAGRLTGQRPLQLAGLACFAPGSSEQTQRMTRLIASCDDVQGLLLDAQTASRRLGRYGLAFALLDELSRQDRLDTATTLGLVRDRMSAGGDAWQPARGLQVLDRLDPSDCKVARLRAIVLLDLGRGEDALAAMQVGEVGDQGSWAVHRARALLLCDRSEEAERLLTDAAHQGVRSAQDLLAALAEEDHG
jgi:hypothetical protein